MIRIGTKHPGKWPHTNADHAGGRRGSLDSPLLDIQLKPPPVGQAAGVYDHPDSLSIYGTPKTLRQFEDRYRHAPVENLLIMHPDRKEILAFAKGGRDNVAIPKMDKDDLRGIFEPQGADVLVITMYETSKVAKYWRKQ